jgi:uncharacterized protein YtpQ (UPF0354 family)
MRFLRQTVVLVAFCIGFTAAAEIPQPATTGETLGLLQNAFVAHPSVSEARIDSENESVLLSGPDGATYTVFPDNIHRTLFGIDDAGERQQALDDFVSAILSAFLDSTGGDRSDVTTILPVLRPLDFAANIETPSPLVSDPFVGDMAIYYVFDRPQTISYITQTDLDELALDVSVLGSLARANMTMREWQPDIDGDGLYILILDGTFEASLLLDTRIWTLVDEQLDQVIVAAPSRDLVVFTDRSFDGAEAALRQVVEDFGPDSAYPLSTEILIWQSSGWQVLSP